METHGRIRDRRHLPTSSPSLPLWLLALALAAGTAIMSVQAGELQWDGFFTTAAVVVAIAVLARFRGWHFWPW